LIIMGVFHLLKWILKRSLFGQGCSIFLFSCMSAAMGHQIGKSVGIVEDVETEDDGVGWGTYLRVKIRLDIAKPLARGRVLKMNGRLSE